MQFILKSILNSIDDLIFVKDINFVYLGCNQAFCDFVGLAHDDIVGKTDFEIFPEDLANWFRSWDQKVISQNKKFQIEERCQHPQKGHIWVGSVDV